MTTSIIDRIATTISYYTRLFQHNEALAQQAHDWQLPCYTHHVPRFRDIMKVQAGLPEKECWSCHLCEIERRRAALAQPKPRSINTSPTYKPGNIFLAPIQAERAYQEEAIRHMTMERVPTLPRSTGEIPQSVLTHIPQANIPTLPPPRFTGSLPAKDIVYALTQRSDDEDATEMRPAIRLPRMIQKTTGDLRIEVLLDVLAQPTSPHETGEQEKLPAKIEDGAFLL